MQPVPSEDCQCEEIREGLLGYTGETYRDRRVVLACLRPQLFGGGDDKSVYYALLTLHNGILNEFTMGKDDKSLNYHWLFLDAMSDMGTFTRTQLFERVEKQAGPDAKKTALNPAYAVTKGHHTMKKRQDRGMAYIVETVGEEGGELKFRIRGRTILDTQLAMEHLSTAQKIYETNTSKQMTDTGGEKLASHQYPVPGVS
jgi:hypothetical protein